MLLLFLNPDLLLVSELIKNKELISKEIEKLFEDSFYLKIDDLFEIRYGLLELRYKKEIEEMESEAVAFLRPSMLREEDNTLTFPKEIDEILSDKKEKKAIQKKGLLTIPAKHVLEEDDILLTSKGENRFVYLSQSAWTYNFKLVASHHFIVLKMKNNILEHLGIQRSYLAATLRFVVEKELKNRLEEIKEEKKDEINKIKEKSTRRSISSILPALSIDDLKSIQIAVPKSKVNQEAIVEKYNSLEELRKGVEATITVWEQHFLKINKGERL
jgi:hypothetical protein